MDRDEVWQAIDAQRLSVAGILEQLSDDEWVRPSWCDGWTVRDVAAHLTLQQIGLVDAVRDLIRIRGPLDRMIREAARRRAALPTDQLIDRIRGMVGSRRHNIGVTHLETLIDILVHGQDITVPLGRRLDMPPDAAAAAATRVWTLGGRLDVFHARRKMRGFRISATDVPWTAGEGAEVSGPIDAILLVLTGRLAALPRLSGEGAPALTAQLTAPAPST